MEKSGEERFLMGISMYNTSRKIIEVSLPESNPSSEKRKNIFNRFYGNDFSETQKEEIINFLTKKASNIQCYDRKNY